MQEVWSKIAVPRQDISNEMLCLWYEGLCDAVIGDKNLVLAEESEDYRQGWVDGVEFKITVADDGRLAMSTGKGMYTWKPNTFHEKKVVDTATLKLWEEFNRKCWGEDATMAEAVKNLKENMDNGQAFHGLADLEAWGPGATTFADAQGLVSEAAYRVYGKEPSSGPTLRTRILKIIDRAADIDDDTIVATIQKVWDGEMEYRLAREDVVHNLETSLAVARHRADWMADALQDKDERIKKLERELGRYLAQDRMEGRL